MMISEHAEFRFLVLNQKCDWEKGVLDFLQASDEGIKLKEKWAYTLDTAINAAELGFDLEILDFAVGQCQLVYILDSNKHAIYVLDTNQLQLERIDCIDTMFEDPIGITFTPGSLYVAEKTWDQRIFNFSQTNWQIRWTIDEGHDAAGRKLNLEQLLKPVDLVVDKDGNLYVLDRDNLAIVQFNKAGNFVGSFGHQELSGKEPVALAVSQNGTVYVLERKEKRC